MMDSAVVGTNRFHRNVDAHRLRGQPTCVEFCEARVKTLAAFREAKELGALDRNSRGVHVFAAPTQRNDQWRIFRVRSLKIQISHTHKQSQYCETGMTPAEEPELQLLITFENEDAAMAKDNHTPAHLRVERALSAFLSALSEAKNIEECEARTSEFKDRVLVTLDELNKATHQFLNPNLYRITVRDREGRTSSRETRAASLYLAVQGQDEQFELVKVERIHPITGKVLGGFYNG